MEVLDEPLHRDFAGGAGVILLSTRILTRAARQYDVPAIVGLEHRDWNRHILAEFFRDPKYRVLVAESGSGQIVGWCLFYFHEHSIELCRLLVSRNHRRQGIGSQLLGDFVAAMSRRKLCVVEASIGDDACLFLRKNGFTGLFASDEGRMNDVLTFHRHHEGECCCGRFINEMASE